MQMEGIPENSKKERSSHVCDFESSSGISGTDEILETLETWALFRQ